MTGPGSLATRIVARIALITLLAIVAVLAWWAVWRPHVMMREVGLSGLLPESGRRCEDPPGTPWRHCYRLRPTTAYGMGVDEQVSLIRRTRRITLAMRAWQATDSVEWSQALDSITRRLDRAGGEPIKCPRASGLSDGGRRIAAWRFREQDVRVLADREHIAEARPPLWRIQVMGFPVGYSGCQSWVRGQRWLTPAEVAEQLQRWLVEHAE